MNADQAKAELEALLRAMGEEGVSLQLFSRRASTLDALRLAISSLTLLSGKKPIVADEKLRKGMAWSHEEEERLLREFDSGKGVDELAALLGRSPHAVSSRLMKLGRGGE